MGDKHIVLVVIKNLVGGCMLRYIREDSVVCRVMLVQAVFLEGFISGERRYFGAAGGLCCNLDKLWNRFMQY